MANRLITRLNTRDIRIANEILRARNVVDPDDLLQIKQLCCLKSLGIILQYDPKQGRFIAYQTYPNGKTARFPVRNIPRCELPGRTTGMNFQRFQRSEIRRRLLNRLRNRRRQR